MKDYIVTVQRTEWISFRVRASSPQDAEERYLMDGDEIASGGPSQPEVTSIMLEEEQGS